jgi:ANTAR domain/PAS fold
LVAHKHPEDRPHTDDVLAAVLQNGQPFCCRHRIITSQQQIRTVVTIGQGVLDGDGRVSSVHGYFVDISDAGRHATEAEIHDAVDRSAATRAVIEQAKGALMLVQGVSAQDAFAVLRWHSSQANRKLRDIVYVTEGMCQPLTPQETPTQRISRLLATFVPEFVAVSASRHTPNVQ